MDVTLLRALWLRRCEEALRRVRAAEEARLDAALDALVDGLSLEEQARGEAWALRCDGLALAALRRRCATGAATADMRLLTAVAARREASRLAEQVARVREQQAASGDPDHGDVLARASRYLMTIEASGSMIFEAAIRMVKGFCLGEAAALDLMWREYVPRMRAPASPGELRAVVRRAGRANRVGLGWLL